MNDSNRANRFMPVASRRLALLVSTGLAMASIGHAASVTDGATGLQWDACAWGQGVDAGANCTGSPVMMDWQQALATAQQANAALYQGHADWRVPNRTELESTVSIVALPTGTGATFWSSTSYRDDPARAWMVDFGDGGSHPADKSDAFALRLVRGGELVLSVGNGERYARYGHAFDVTAMFANTGRETARQSVRFSLSAGLDAGQLAIACYGAGDGASCDRDLADPLHYTVVLPPDRSLTWLVAVMVRGDAQDASATIGVTATDTTPAADSRTLVLFRDGFDSPYADGAQ